MLTTTTALFPLLCSLVASLSLASTVTERASRAPCQTDPILARYGFFGGITDRVTHFGLDAAFQVVEPSKAVISQFNASFEVCSALGPASLTYPQLESPVYGRIVLTPSLGGPHTCLTIINPSDAQSGKPLFARAQACDGDVTPAVSQRWIYGYLDDFGGMFWVGGPNTPGHKDGYGLLETDTLPSGALITDKSGRIELALRTKPPQGGRVLDFEFLD
ncbi:hypothetical protein HGRIS_007270 [Hohenbuehelia grisea]|uniref:Ricin B lectin domain-containing protein n=1 Tax=Hohenbuehelia grisea TaxID=104357 RepID=A0ABR3JC51_9AGAR